MNVRAHPTVRPHALALGVFPRRGVVDKLGALGPALAQDVVSALLLDTLGVLSTIPVRHRVVFMHGEDVVTRQMRLPATWRELAQRGSTPGERLSTALEDLEGFGAEAMLLVAAEGPMLPLGAIYEGFMWLLEKRRVVIGEAEGGGGLYALGATDRLSFLTDTDLALGIAGTPDERVIAGAAEHVETRAAAAGMETQRLPRSYRVDSLESLKRLRREVEAGAFAPHCRKLFERPDVARAASD